MSKPSTRFPDLRRRIPGSLPRAADETRLESASANERLNRLSGFRIHTDAILFTSSKPHGSGGNAEVVKATYKRGNGSDQQQVAVKKLRYYSEINKRKFGNELVHEVDIMARLSHENIVRLIGFVEDVREGKAWIVLSWEPNGNVSEFLATGEWEIPERISLIQDTFEGIEYLHTRQPPICHGDLKSLNILVSASYRAIITDFGSARILKEGEDRPEDRDKIRDVTGASAVAPATDERIDSTEITIVASSNHLTLTGPAWSLRWAAPEVALVEPQNLASDIWAAGWICWEVITNKVPFPELNAEGAIVLKVVEGQVPVAREDRQLSQIVRLCSLMTDCWAFDPRNRPNISQCKTEVNRMPSIPPLKGKTSDSNAPSAALLLEMGRIHYSQNKLKEAISVYQQALSTARSARDQENSGLALCRLGGVYYSTGNHAQAEQYFTQAQDIFTQIGYDAGQADVLRFLAKVYCGQSKLTQAEEYYTRARNIFSRIGHDEGQANTLLGLGNVFSESSQYPEAEELYNQAQDIYARIGHHRGRANTFRRLGLLCQERSAYIKAEELFNQALDIYCRIGDNMGRANVKGDIADLYRVQGLNTKAAPLYAEAKSFYALIGDSKWERKCSHWLDVVSKEGDSSTTSLSVPGNDDVPSPAPQQ
ncbi:hypothetical protein M407DRAFT_32314 [Tulasnella calospora MUT 4182]|uniref:Protein kinase domain-containing protein n=1 Tax=Tulasnella calospora MUT 4182 TaxID=1051891 RepID=A0A0C3Q4Z2_9AGAM|nr:hypothetical protein M407DRAFT_32314 [Tulasnella calospora MUT 4182]